MTVRHWINQPSYRWKTFVANRVSEIQQISKDESVVWHHCPGQDNPADIVSRGATVKELKDRMWLHGPQWLTRTDLWPAEHLTSTGTVEEVRVQAVLATPDEQKWWTRLSRWTRVVGMVARILSWKYRYEMKRKIRQRAEQIIFKIIQRECFPQELTSLMANQRVQRDSRLLQFRPCVDDDGIIRANRRLQLSDLDEDTKYPIVLADHNLTVLLLRHIHESNMHLGVEGCVAFARRRFAVVACRRIVRRIKNQCTVCRRFDAPSGMEVSPPLPQDRVSLQRPFSVVGIDHAGPLVAKVLDSNKKVWILLFVCATTRAVNLQLVQTMSTEDVILGYRRFVARHGTPALIRSDNGPAFVAAAKMIPVDWRFNPPPPPP